MIVMENPQHNTGMDRRSARTRAALQQAHIELILERGYENVTVQEICDRANIGRSTFYAHYTDKDHLKRSGIERLRQDLLAASQHANMRDDHQPFGFTRALFEHAEAHVGHYRALADGPGAQVAISAVRDILSDMVKADIATSPTSAPHAALVEFTVGAFMAVLLWWLKDGARIPPETMDVMFRDLLSTGIPLRR